LSDAREPVDRSLLLQPAKGGFEPLAIVVSSRLVSTALIGSVLIVCRLRRSKIGTFTLLDRILLCSSLFVRRLWRIIAVIWLNRRLLLDRTRAISCVRKPKLARGVALGTIRLSERSCGPPLWCVRRSKRVIVVDWMPLRGGTLAGSFRHQTRKWFS